MSRLSHQSFLPRSQPRWNVHPIWRGIGCIFMLLLPVMSFVGAYLIIRENFRQGWVALPASLLRSFSIPSFGTVYLADIALTLVFIIMGFGILTVGYAFLYRLIGPPRFGPLDAPPLKKRRRLYKK